MEETRNHRLCPCQGTSGNEIPFVLKMSHNTKAVSELTGRNKSEIAGIAEKRMARTLHGAWQSQNPLKKFKTHKNVAGNSIMFNDVTTVQSTSESLRYKDHEISSNCVDKSLTSRAGNACRAYTSEKQMPTTQVTEYGDSEYGVVGGARGVSGKDDGIEPVLLLKGAWIAPGRTRHRTAQAKRAEDFEASRVAQASRSMDDVLKLERDHVLGLKYTEYIRKMRKMLDGYNASTYGIAERRLNSRVDRDKADGLPEGVDRASLPTISSQNKSRKKLAFKEVRPSTNLLTVKDLTLVVHQGKKSRRNTLSAKSWLEDKKTDLRDGKQSASTQADSLNSSRSSSTPETVDLGDDVVPCVKKMEIHRKVSQSKMTSPSA